MAIDHLPSGPAVTGEPGSGVPSIVTTTVAPASAVPVMTGAVSEVMNEPGVLANVAGMFAARGFNIDSLVVGRTEKPELSRMTVVVDADENTLDQVRKQLAKLVPVWGSAFGATSAFATTWALGKIANRYFERGCPADLSELKKEMKAVEKEAKEAYARQIDAIEAKRRDTEAKLIALAEQRKTGAITQAEYEQQVAALAT